MENLLRPLSNVEEEVPPTYECALAELQAAGVAEDVRPLVQSWIDTPGTMSGAHEKLPPADQAELAHLLSRSAGDAARADGLRNEHLALAKR